MSIWRWYRCRSAAALRSRAGRHTWQGSGVQLTVPVRREPPPSRPVTVVHTTVRQTVIQVCHTRNLQLFHRTEQIQALRSEAFVLMVQPFRREPAAGLDLSRPTFAAQRLLRVFSMESARRQLRPFYSSIVRSVLKEEQDRYRSRPAQAISLIWHLFGRQQAFRTLTRFYLSAVEKLGTNYYPALHGQNALYLAAGVVLHSQVYQRYLNKLWSRETPALEARYAHREQEMADDMVQLQVARRILPPREALEQIAETRAELPARRADVAPAREIRLTDADFRALVQGVSSSLGRRSRLNALRRGENAL